MNSRLSGWSRQGRSALGLIVAATFILGGTVTAWAAAAEMSLSAAIKQGAAEVYITGRGYSTGDALQLRVRKKVAGDVTIKVEPGTVVVDTKGRCQSMVLYGVKWHWSAQAKWIPCSEITLKNNAEQFFILEGYCRDAKLPSPQKTDYFTLAKPDEASLQVLIQGKKNGCTAKIIQAAIWIARDRVQDAYLAANFHCNEREIQAARSLLEVAHATADEVLRHEATLQEVLAQLRVHVSASGTIQVPEMLRQFGVTKEAEVTADARVTGPLGRVGVEVARGQRFAVLDEREGRVLVAGNVGALPVRGWIAADKVVIRDLAEPTAGAAGAAAIEVGRVRDVVLEVINKVD